MIPLGVIVGPTAVGKTAVAIAVARKLDGEIVSADSMLVYRHMDIGTAKPAPAERCGIPHHLVDIIDPDTSFSVADYQEAATKAINGIWQRGKLPLLVGGTGLYVRAVTDGYRFSPTVTDWAYRRHLEQLAADHGNTYLHAMLLEVDPASASRLHPNDRRRIIRALEVYHQTGQPLSALQGKQGSDVPYRLAQVGLTIPRPLLYQRIEARVDQMIAQGLVEEVRCLLNMGYSTELPALQGLGYKEIAGYLAGEYDLATAINLIKRNTRHFAKRQLTWFKRVPGITWVDAEVYPSIDDLAEDVRKIIAGKLGI